MDNLNHLRLKSGEADSSIQELTEQQIEERRAKSHTRARALRTMAMWGGLGAAGVIGSIMDRADRAAEAAEKDRLYHAVGEANFKRCRKKCKLFKQNKCWLKSYDEQRRCHYDMYWKGKPMVPIDCIVVEPLKEPSPYPFDKHN